MKRQWIALAGTVVLIAIAFTNSAGAARRNWAYLHLSHGNLTRWRDATAGTAAGTRADELVLLRRSVQLGDWTMTQRMLAVHGADPDRLAPLIVLHEAVRRADGGDLAGARAALSAVSAQSGYDSGVWYRLGEALELARLPHEAVQAYDRGAVHDAASPWSEGRYRIAMVYRREEQWQLLADLLAPLFRTATDRELEQPIQALERGGAVWQGIFLALGEAYDHLGRAAEAEATYERLTRIESPRRDWTLNRAFVYLSRAKQSHGDFVPALEAIARGLDLSTEFESSYRRQYELDTAAEADRLVDQVRRANRLDAFQSDVDDLTRRLPQSPGAWYMRGLTSEALCDKNGARTAYERASRLIGPGTGAFLAGRPIDPPRAPCLRH